jgi:hypothetical protein
MFNKIKVMVVTVPLLIRSTWDLRRLDLTLKAVEIAMNNDIGVKSALEQIKKQNILQTLEDPQNQEELKKVWKWNDFVNNYPENSLGNDFGKFMINLGFGNIIINFDKSVPELLCNSFRLGAKNHDFIHLLLGLYDYENGKYSISEFHEWVFLAYTMCYQKDNFMIRMFDLPIKLKAFIKGEYHIFQKAKFLGTKLAKCPIDLNSHWLIPYFDKPIEQVRQELGIVTLSEAAI